MDSRVVRGFGADWRARGIWGARSTSSSRRGFYGLRSYRTRYAPRARWTFGIDLGQELLELNRVVTAIDGKNHGAIPDIACPSNSTLMRRARNQAASATGLGFHR